MIRSKDHRFDLRLHLVRYALEHGIHSAARHFKASRRTVRKWLRRWKADGIRGLENRSRAPKSCPHKTPSEQEQEVLRQRKRTPGFGAARLKREFELRPSTGTIARILRQNGLTKRRKRKHQTKRDLRAIKEKYLPLRRFQMDVKNTGIALLLTVGILVMLALGATALLSLAGQLRLGAALQLDQTQARLLARSGIEYGSARLFQDSTAKIPPTPANQADDWTYRDGPDVPVERSANPSYAQSEPYTEMGIPNGRFDAGVEPYADRIQNARFDAWSGRLRGRHGLAGSTFVLKISGENAEGGINVNSGFLSNTDINLNHVRDYRDLGGAEGDDYRKLRRIESGFDAPPISYNRRIAAVINELSLLLGGIGTPRPGDAIVRNRPVGGYDSLDQVASLCGFFPPDWTRLARHLTVRSSRNGSSASLDANYLVNVGTAPLETVAAAFSGMAGYPPLAIASGGNSTYGIGVLLNDITPSEALRAAGYLKSAASSGRLEWFFGLQANRDSIFETGAAFKAAVVHALAIPEDLRLYNRMQAQKSGGSVYYPTPYQSWITYDHAGGRYGKNIWNREGSALNSIDLDAGAASSYSVRSLGRCADAARGASGLYGAGRIRVDNQRDFENLTEDETVPGRFEGGSIVGRPIRNRTTTYPCFSRDACPELRGHPYTRIRECGYYGPPDPSGGLLETAGRVEWDEFPLEFGYCHYYGEVMLADRSWVDPSPACSFYQPNWDLDQPERPESDRVHPTLARNFEEISHTLDCSWSSASGEGYEWTPMDKLGDPALAALWTGTAGWSMTHLGSSVDYPSPSGNYLTPARDTLGFIFQWPVNEHPFGSSAGRIDQGTAESWCVCSVPCWEGLVPSPDGSSIWVGTRGACEEWRQHSATPNAPPKFVWTNPAPPSVSPCHVAFTFGPDGMNAYADGIRQGGGGYEAKAVDSTKRFAFTITNQDEMRLYREPLAAEACRAHALKGRYWTADPEGKGSIAPPSFTSPRYRFDAITRIRGAVWDGFVPKVIQEATEAWNEGNPDEPKCPLRVELLAELENGSVEILPFSPESWKKGGPAYTEWKRSPPVRSVRYRVWMDVSALDRAWRTPVFDAIRLDYKLGRLANLREE